jgi:hypothetical protein
MLAAPAIGQEKAGNGQSAEKPANAAAGKLIPVTPKDAAWVGQARKSYPLEVCVASDEKLGSMGDSPHYIYRVDGKPDRLVIFCCEGCEDDFKKEPAKYIAKLDAAAAKKSAPGKASTDKPHKGEHK